MILKPGTLFSVGCVKYSLWQKIWTVKPYIKIFSKLKKTSLTRSHIDRQVFLFYSAFQLISDTSLTINAIAFRPRGGLIVEVSLHILMYVYKSFHGHYQSLYNKQPDRTITKRFLGIGKIEIYFFKV